MTMNHSEIAPVGTALAQGNEQIVSDRMTKFLADELIPLMAGFWHKSANQLNVNLRGNAMAYGVMLKGFSANVIRDEVAALADREPDRDFAPSPQELKKLCAMKIQPQKQPGRFIASMSSLEMQIFAKCLNGQVEKTQCAVDAELEQMIDSVYAKGGTVDGRPGWQPLKTLVQPRYWG